MRHLEQLIAIDYDFDLCHYPYLKTSLHSGFSRVIYDYYFAALISRRPIEASNQATWWQLFDIPPDVMRDGVQARLRYLREQFDATAEPLM